VTSFYLWSHNDDFSKVVVTTFKNLSSSDNICNGVEGGQQKLRGYSMHKETQWTPDKEYWFLDTPADYNISNVVTS
jgi:hypothetical protein